MISYMRPNKFKLTYIESVFGVSEDSWGFDGVAGADNADLCAFGERDSCDLTAIIATQELAAWKV